jgi:hypothetical protein
LMMLLESLSMLLSFVDVGGKQEPHPLFKWLDFWYVYQA